jgi:mRNA interferase MazF
MVIMAALTSQPQKAGFPLTLELAKAKNLTKKSWAKIRQIRTLSAQRLGEKISTVNKEELSQIIEGLNEIIGRYHGAGALTQAIVMHHCCPV